MEPLLHELTTRQIDTALVAGSGSYAFHGPRGTGKATTAQYVAQRLNCEGDQSSPCASCRLFESASYPDYILLQPEDRPSITIEQVRVLSHALSLSPYRSGGTRVVVIDEAQALTVEAQNALLKLVEEPPEQTLFIFVTEQLEALLPTVRSRLAAIYFGPVSVSAITALVAQLCGLTAPEAARLAAFANGAPGVALRLANDPQASAVRTEIEAAVASALSGSTFDRLLLARRLVDKKTDLRLLAHSLQQAVLRQLQNATLAASSARQLAALEQFRKGLSANLGARVALERLMLEL